MEASGANQPPVHFRPALRFHGSFRCNSRECNIVMLVSFHGMFRCKSVREMSTSHTCPWSFKEVAFMHVVTLEATGTSQTKNSQIRGDQRGEACGHNMNTCLPVRRLCGSKPSCALRSADGWKSLHGDDEEQLCLAPSERVLFAQELSWPKLFSTSRSS